jgi:hypothetical protein
MLSGDCNVCINGKMPSYSATCVECGLSRKNYKPISHADRIRAMTDEELAGWLAKHNERSAVCPNFGARDCQASCRKCWLDWLKQEASE